MKKLLITIVLVLVFMIAWFILLYMLGAFYNSKFDPSKWTEQTRSWIVFGMVIFMCFAPAIGFQLSKELNLKPKPYSAKN